FGFTQASLCSGSREWPAVLQSLSTARAGLVNREALKKLLEQAMGKAPHEPTEIRPPAHESRPTPAPRTLQGRWIESLLEDRRVVELQVSGGSLGWGPEPQVRIQLEDGTWIDAQILFDGTTRPGMMADGLVIRVVL